MMTPSRQGFDIVKLGVIGNGGRGSWIAGLFQKHGGYEMHAVADYFPEVADKSGEALGVAKNRRYSQPFRATSG
jgi:predicted dehydrogenase